MFLLVFGSCFGSHDEAGLLAFEALQAYRGLPEARMYDYSTNSICLRDGRST